MSKYTEMTSGEIKVLLNCLEAESRTASPARLQEIEQETQAAYTAINTNNFKQEERQTITRGGQPQGQFNVLGTYSMGVHPGPVANENREALKVKYEQRGADLKNRRPVTFDLEELNFRAITIGVNNLVVPTISSNTLNDTFNQVSNVVDLVNGVPLNGGESYKKGFIVGYGEGGYTDETADYTDADPVTDYVNIGKAKITAYTELSDEAQKLPNVMYQEMAMQAIQIALRKKISKQILIGPGGANSLVGIFNAPVNVIPPASDIEITEIDADTLDKIVFGYGGDEDVSGGAYLILNKNDLAAFAAVRDANGLKKLYKITLDVNGNTGTISSEDSFSVPFIINSACSALSSAGTVAGTYCMAYGKIKNYEMPMFSPVTVEESRDFKFKSGQTCYRGSVWAGGNVAAYKGFVRVKKKA
ncbi:MAG: phage major capsid protein [Syntrophomonas sp.]